MLTHIIEALFFAAGKGISYKELLDNFGGEYTEKEIHNALNEIKKEYSDEKGIVLIEYNNKFQFQSNSIYGEKLVNILQPIKEKELSKTLLQTLSIIAYKQPITRMEIEEVRNGVSCDYAISVLLKLDLIDVVGRKMQSLGRPALFGTTDEFLKKFGLKDLESMPDYEKLLEEVQNSDKYYKNSDKLFRMDNDKLDGEDDFFDKFDDDIPEHLKNEDIVVVE